tara:strand:- start:461 stop:1942 length:1482 start_codon:yes stop_codon:yes gene_type:complete
MSFDKTKTSIWSSKRRPRDIQGENAQEQDVEHEPSYDNHRSIFQQDYDRLLFSAPVRRLSDKTQVWPMDENDGVRTRLTHSHEVANLARSIGTKVYYGAKKHFSHSDGSYVSLQETIQPLLLASGLGHDLGNPPFGHQGEAAIGNWFKSRSAWIYTYTSEAKSAKSEELDDKVSKEQRSEFESFDGNPQTLRLITTLQSHIDNVGLDLSAATLATGLKYAVSYENRKGDGSLKKGGYFSSEKNIVDWLRSKTGLQEGQRHPLTWIMEACDDIAYSVLDVDDVLKKGMISPNDVLVFLRANSDNKDIVDDIEIKFQLVEKRIENLDTNRDIKIEYLRALLIGNLVSHASAEFVNNADNIFDFTNSQALMDSSSLCDSLKKIAQQTAFNHPSVLKAEAIGAEAIDGLMTAFWSAICNRKEKDDLLSRRLSARDKYVFSLISPNYLYHAENKDCTNGLSLRYRELRLLTDMVSGMTDSFAIRLWEDLRSIPYVNCT